MTEETRVEATGIVVGTDGSGDSNEALAWAAHAAAAYGLPLTVLFARPDADAVPELVTDPDGPLGVSVAEVKSHQPDLEIHALQMPDSPVESLLAAGQTADFVVLGSRGKGGFSGLLLGSTALNVTPYVECPVVVVHRHGKADDGEECRNRGQVVLGYDGSTGSNRAAAFAFRHAQALGCGVVVVTVEPQRGDPESREVDPTTALPGSDTGVFHAPIIVTAESFPDVEVTFVAGLGRPDEVLISEGRGAELLVVGSRGVGGFKGLVMGSVSQKVIAHASCPVAVLHAGITAAAAVGLDD